MGRSTFGKSYDMQAGEIRDDVILYDSKDLTTHGVIVGMTGSGKTGSASRCSKKRPSTASRPLSSIRKGTWAT
ncbi:MAG: hypothetical protein R3C02_01690 [Planctomycetaceae bacterium]